MKIAVLGGNGYLGSHVTKYFNATPLSRRTGFDITKPKDCEQLKDYDVVIHMAALVDKSDEARKEVHRVNTYGTFNVIEELGKGQTLIFASTKDTYTENTHYATSKAVSEVCIQHYSNQLKFRHGIFRLSTTYAPPTNGSNFVNHFVKCIQEGKKISLVAEGKQTRDFLYVTDLCRAFEQFIDKKDVASDIWNIGGGKYHSTTILGLVKIIEYVVGKKAKISYSKEKPTGQIDYVTNLDRILLELHWLPSTCLPEGIRRIIE